VPHETNQLASLSAALAHRYRIERELGAGGMATVYLAQDLKHGRQVAVKVLRQEVGAVLGKERFLAEIRLTAALQHPNILPLFDSGSEGDQLYYVMPFVRGESLREKLTRETSLPVDEAVAIGRGIADALDHAHRQGVIHRDIKPENILLSDGVPMVADFGIARALSAAGGERVTQTGVVVGTPSYMSPEQAMGGAELDERADLYALGCVLFEMLTGRTPFSGPTAAAVISQHVVAPVPSARDLRTTVPPTVDGVIVRALAKDPNERFATAKEMGAALVAPPPIEPLPDYSQVAEPVTRTTTPLAGRRKEFAQLMERLDAMADGHGGTVLIGGEPGVGKTKLAEALLLEARARGYVCAVGHCYEMEGSPPYLPFIEQWEWAIRNAPPGRLRAALGSGAAEFARIMPRLRQAFPDIGEPLDLPPDQQRHYLFTQFRDYYGRVTANVPVVGLFDDLHWADESTLLLLEFLAPHLSSMRLLLLGTYRDVELEVGRPFAKSLERLTRQRLAQRIALRRMPSDDVKALLAQLGAPDPPPALVQAVYAETEGNPFFVEEVFRHLKDEGRLLDADGRWLPDLKIEGLEVPEGVRLVIGRRLERVSETCRNVLTAAAVIGPRFDLAVLEAVGEAGGDAMLDALEEAERAGLAIGHQVKRETSYTFAHELVRQTLLEALSVPRRLRRHLKTAQAMGQLYVGREAQHASELAYHYFQSGSGDEEKTTRYLLLAGQQALAAAAFDEALAQAERAFSVFEDAGERRRADLLWLRASALRGLGHWNEAITVCQNALELLLSLGAGDEALTLASMFAGMLFYWGTEQSSGLGLVHRVLAATPPVPSVDRAQLLAAAANLHMMTGEFARGRSLSDEALAMAKAVGNPEVLGMVLSSRAALLTNTGYITEALPCAAEACALLERSGRRWEALWAQSRLVYAKRFAGCFHEVLALVNAASGKAQEVGHRGASLAMQGSRALAAYALEPRVSLLEEAGVELQRDFADFSSWRELGVLLAAWAAFERGDDRGAALAQDADGRFHEEFWKDAFWSTAFWSAAQVDVAKAREILDANEHRIPTQGGPAWIGARWSLPPLVWGLSLIGESSRAHALYPVCVETIQLGSVGDFQMHHEAAGRAAAAGRDWEAAERHFDSGLRLANDNGNVAAQADIRLAHAEMLLARGEPGDAARARTMLEEAAPMFERSERTRRLRQCRGYLEQIAGD
jgi:tetratricopeptide (TPR) repeat protein